MCGDAATIPMSAVLIILTVSYFIIATSPVDYTRSRAATATATAAAPCVHQEQLSACMERFRTEKSGAT